MIGDHAAQIAATRALALTRWRVAAILTLLHVFAGLLRQRERFAGHQA